MDIRNYVYKKHFDKLTTGQKIFIAKRIMKEVERIAKKLNIPEEIAYEVYVRGVFEVDIFTHS